MKTATLKKVASTVAVNFAFCDFCRSFAQEKQAPPAGGPPKPFNVPAHETYSLPNGMKVTLVPYGNLPKVTLSLVIRTGNLNEPADMPGLADLVGKLMKEGTTSKSSKQIAEESARHGRSRRTITVGADESDVDTDVLSDFGPRGGDAAGRRGAASAVSRIGIAAFEERRLAAAFDFQSRCRKTWRWNGSERFFTATTRTGRFSRRRKAFKRLPWRTSRNIYEGNFGAARSHLYVAGRFDVRRK